MITLLDIALARGAKLSDDQDYRAEFERVRVTPEGECRTCGTTLMADTAFMSRTGGLRCVDHIGTDGFELEMFEGYFSSCSILRDGTLRCAEKPRGAGGYYAEIVNEVLEELGAVGVAPPTKEQRFLALCKSFHQLARAPHIDPFDDVALDDWLNDSGARTSGLQACVSFVLWVYHGGGGYERVNPFEIGDRVRIRAACLVEGERQVAGKVAFVDDEGKLDIAWDSGEPENRMSFRLFEYADESARENYCAEHRTTGWGYRTPPFDMIRAWQVWDSNHKAAFMAWVADPFWL